MNPEETIIKLASHSSECCSKVLSEMSGIHRDEKSLICLSYNIHSSPKHYEEFLSEFESIYFVATDFE